MTEQQLETYKDCDSASQGPRAGKVKEQWRSKSSEGQRAVKVKEQLRSNSSEGQTEVKVKQK